MRITKIHKNKSGGFNIFWQVQPKNEWVNCGLPCTQKPRPEFEKALQNLKVDVIDMCELSTDYGKSMEVIGVAFSYNEKGVEYGIKIIAIKRMEKSIGTMSIITPYKARYEETPKKKVEKRKGWDTTHERILPLIKEAQKYIDGKRSDDAQEQLPLMDGKTEQEKKKKPKKRHPKMITKFVTQKMGSRA